MLYSKLAAVFLPYTNIIADVEYSVTPGQALAFLECHVLVHGLSDFVSDFGVFPLTFNYFHVGCRHSFENVFKTTESNLKEIIFEIQKYFHQKYF
ncbi:unnamed protein product [Malus baccata var. baccata]